MKDIIKCILGFIFGFIFGIILVILSIKLLSDIIITREECERNGGTFIDGTGDINNKCIYDKR